MAAESAPILSTPAERLLEASQAPSTTSERLWLSDEQLYVQYEVGRTVNEIRRGRWTRIAMQFPDEMLADAPRVFQLLRHGLVDEKKAPAPKRADEQPVVHEEDFDVRLTILADTSYGACCVDEIAAEHVEAEVIVHYGRSCLSPTARLPVIHVFTAMPLATETLLRTFATTYPAKEDKICVMADTPYQHHLDSICAHLAEQGYSSIHKTEILHDPSSPLPNRSVPDEVQGNVALLKEWSVFHVAEPPTSLLLVLASRIKSVHVFSTQTTTVGTAETSTAQLLRRRYALLTRLSTVPVIGILINTLSVSNYMNALKRCEDIISRAGKKSYVIVVGKLNPAKMANFSEIGGWVVIGCWESSLIESKEFYRPIVTPFELEIALTNDNERVWSGQWIADFSTLLELPIEPKQPDINDSRGKMNDHIPQEHDDGIDDLSDEEPPEFDLRTGRLVSQSRPMRIPQGAASGQPEAAADMSSTTLNSALIQRAPGEIASIRGVPSPGAEFLRSKRTWQGLGSDPAVSTEHDASGAVVGAILEDGRDGIARGYDAEGANKIR